MSDLKSSNSASRDTKWVEGLRGLAAVLVVTSHLAVGYADFLEAPRSANQPPRWYNLPFLRVVFEGSPFVSVFLILTGFVNALKPIKQARAGHADAALSGLASSCFRRSLRLMLPCTIATVICWVLAEMGGFRTGGMAMSHWMVTTCAKPSGGAWAAIFTLFRAILDTWTWNHNELERNQWAMLHFLKGALAVYIFMLATMRAKPRYRMSIAAALILYGWRGYDTSIFMPIFTGVLLAEVSMTAAANDFSSARSLLIRPLPYISLFLGWFLISYPTRSPGRMPWSDSLLLTGLRIFPADADLRAYWNQIGVTLIIASIVFSTSIQRLFNLRVLQWLGARSFPIYLVHGPVLRSFHNWIVFAGARVEWIEERDAEGNAVGFIPMFRIPPASRFMWTMPVFLVVTIVLSNQWYRHVEPFCGIIAKRIEEKVCGGQSEQHPTFVGKIEARDFYLVDAPIGSPLSRATTPMNEVELVLPR